jgi:hypothetical protein
MMKQLIDKTLSWWTSSLIKQQVDGKSIWWNGKLMKLLVDEMASWHNDIVLSSFIIKNLWPLVSSFKGYKKFLTASPDSAESSRASGAQGWQDWEPNIGVHCAQIVPHHSKSSSQDRPSLPLPW